MRPEDCDDQGGCPFAVSAHGDPRARLRRRAELEAGEPNTGALSLDEARAMAHDLRVHQIELEMQNEELHWTQDQLEVSRQLYLDLYDHAPVGYLTVSEAGVILAANLTVTALLGTTRERLIQQPFHRSILLEDRDINYACSRKLLATGTPQACELRMVRPDGSWFWARMDLALAGEGSRQGRVCRVAVCNVSKHHVMEERLQQSEKLQAIGLLAGGVAHDLNNRLTPVLGYADLLVEYLEDEKLNHYARNIRAAAQDSADLIAKLLAFAHKGKHQNLVVDMHQTIVEVSELLEHGANSRIEIRHQLEAVASSVRGDPSQLLRALLNLGLNACDAMPNAGRLTFATRTVTLSEQPAGEDDALVGRCLEIHVTDTGTGMDAETKRHLFEPFYTTKEQGKGTGLGMASVYGTVRNHHGAIDVQSPPGLGTTITILLPLAAVTTALGEIEVPVPTTASVGARILVVEDGRDVREVLKDMLTGQGYRVATCADGAQAVIYYAKTWEDVDLVLLDMTMPGMDGRETYHALRSINPKVRVLLASGYSVEGQAHEILDEGVLGFLQKPFRQAPLVAMVERVLQGRTPNPCADHPAGRSVA